MCRHPGTANKLGLRKTMFPEDKSPKFYLGNSETVTPIAGVEFWATKDTEDLVLGAEEPSHNHPHVG